jgi:anti-sigma factor RsiW
MTTPGPHLTDADAQRLADGTLAPPEAAALERHAEACRGCRATVETYRSLGAALGELELPPLPDDFTSGVLSRIEERERTVARERRHAVAVLGVLAAATAAAFAVAGAAAWAPLLSSAAEAIGEAARAARLGATLAPHAGAFRPQIALAAAALAVPLLVALARLTSPPRGQHA